MAKKLIRAQGKVEKVEKVEKMKLSDILASIPQRASSVKIANVPSIFTNDDIEIMRTRSSNVALASALVMTPMTTSELNALMLMIRGDEDVKKAKSRVNGFLSECRKSGNPNNKAFRYSKIGEKHIMKLA